MNKKSIYNRGKFERETEVAVEEDFKFEEYPECEIFEIDTNDLDYEKTAFLSNFKVVNIKDENNIVRTVLMLILYDENGDWFTSYLHQDPYFLLKCKEGFENDVLSFLEKRFEGEFSSLRVIEKMDLSEMNHLSGKKRKFIKLSFMTVSKMHFVRKALTLKIFEFKRKYKPKKRKNADTFEDIFELIDNLYEHDLSYSARACIDNDIRVAFWYNVTVRKGFVHKIIKEEEILEKPDFSVLAFDIETTKAPLKFPDPDIDCVMLISYVIDQETFLIVNREILSKDIQPFDYNPLPGINSEVIIFNEKDEKQCLLKFFEHIKITKPLIITTFNGDFFDIPFISKRAANHNLDINKILGFKESNSGKFSGEFIFCHLDCFYWVKRDAFLPHGSHGLKAVTKAKLGYNPIEVDPEDMVPLAKDDPQKLCEYSVSDAVATYYLYMKHIHDFVFALCMIVPMNPDDVLRRGSGTLCEYLLMAQAYKNEIVIPNKKKRKTDKYYKGHLIENETYVGGYVECLNNGIYRADIETAFKMDANRYETLIETTKKVIDFFVRVEKSENINNIENINEVKNMVQEKLKDIMMIIKENGNKEIDLLPLIYHVDVSSMYPNIILTNRLQPTAIVNNRICSNCIYNEPKNNCKKNMGWDWKAQYYPISQPEYEKIKLENKRDDLKQAIKTYCQKNYKRYHKTVIEYKEDTVCMREHPFYVDTIRDFRDLRMKYKGLAKVYKKKEREANKNNKVNEANDAHVLGVFYDSLQLAHKIILNSFYGYVMKKGARWYSMEMAAMVTNTGAKIIQESRELMDKIGKPLELDTDGIWTLLPKGFPENFTLKTKNGKNLNFSFPCSLINWLIYDKYKNTQYQTIQKDEPDYKTRTEMSIFFEIDGPYRAMVIPAAREENKKLKKRYCVFNFDGSISEIKGFEIKRRGELGIVKIFQKEIFSQFLKGNSLKTLYDACAETSRKWLRVITEKGKNMSEEKIIELFSQLKVLSKPVSEYNNPNSIAVTSAIRLSKILGTPLGNTGGLNCKYIISKKPINEKLSLRAIPTVLFKLNMKKRNEFLKKWLKVNDAQNETLKTIIDWDYYYERLVFILQKIVIIPAILQGLENPLPEVAGPDWVEKKLAEKNNKHKQVGINQFFSIVPKTIEDIKNLNKGTESAVKKPKFELQEENNENRVNNISKEKMIEEEIMPDKKAMLEDMKSLRLTLLKKKWREERKKKKTNSIDKIQMESQDLQAYAQQIEQKIRQTQWQVIKISKSENGFIKYWILINNKVLISKKIHIYKTIYINSIQKKENLEESKKKLPREKTSYFLYKYDIEERAFHKNFTNLDYYLTNPNIEGVYETNVDLDFRAIALTGNICRLKKGVGRNKNFELEDIVRDKLNKSKNSFDGSIFKGINFLYAWIVEIKNRLFAMVFTLDKLTVIKYQNYKEKKDFSAPYKNYLKESIERNFGENHTHFDADLIEINYLFCDEIEEFNKLFTQVILGNRSELKYSPSLTIIESHTPSINQSIKNLEHHLPLLELKGDLPKDVKYSSLDWHLIFADFGIVKFKNLEDRILLIDNLSSFSKVPICNLGLNVEISIIRAIDVMFARELDENYSIWWFSKNKQPDLGTKKKNQFSENIFQQQILLCNFSTPCISENYVFEIDVNLFHFNSLIVSEIFKDLNKEVLLMKSKNKKNRRNKLFEEFTINNKMGFKIVNKLFLNWYKEVYTRDDKTADIMLQNLVRWMCSEESYFFDPYLKQTFDKIVKNIFEDFIDCLEELGAEIIYADPYKLFIKTSRKTYYSANNFIKFVLESILENTKFSYLKLKIRTVYKTFIFYDIYNYTGLNINLEDIPDDKQVSEEDINRKLGHTSKWKLKEFFPPIVQNYFENVFFEIVVKYTEFLLENQKEAKNKNDLNEEELYKKMENYMFNDFSSKIYELLQHIKQQQRLNEYNTYEENIKKCKEKSIIQENSFIDKSDHFEEEEEDAYEADSFLIDDIGEEEEEPEDHFLNKRYNEPIKKKRKKKKSKKEKTESIKEWVFPNFPGTKYKGKIIVLEFIKILFEVLIRERHYLNDIFLRLKSDLLDFIGVSRYSDEGNFERVFLKFNLINVICKHCFMVRNIDVFMDFDSDSKSFKCICNSYYDKNMIENKILYLLKESYKFYLNQNKYCLDCKSIKEDYLNRKCYCGGNYPNKNDKNLEEFLIEADHGFGNFKNLADLCEFDILKSYLIDIGYN